MTCLLNLVLTVKLIIPFLTQAKLNTVWFRWSHGWDKDRSWKSIPFLQGDAEWGKAAIKKCSYYKFLHGHSTAFTCTCTCNFWAYKFSLSVLNNVVCCNMDHTITVVIICRTMMNQTLKITRTPVQHKITSTMMSLSVQPQLMMKSGYHLPMTNYINCRWARMCSVYVIIIPFM